MYKDNSERTRQIRGPYRKVIVSIFVALLAIIWTIGGRMSYSNMVANSSTAIGSSLKFNRSAADVTLSNVFVDKHKDVLIARLTLSEEARANLPYKGSDYKVYVASKATDGLKSIDVLFGRLSTDGDMFLVLPKPKDEVYSIFIFNKNYVVSSEAGSLAGEAGSFSDEVAQRSVTGALSNYTYGQDNKDNVYTITSDRTDGISFRLAVNPGIESDKYTPIQLDADLLNDKTKTFDFKKFFNLVFKKAATEEVTAEFNKLKDQRTQTEKALQTDDERLQANARDTVAKDNYDKHLSELQNIDSRLEAISKDISQYESLEFSDELFSNLQTKAQVYDTSQLK